MKTYSTEYLEFRLDEEYSKTHKTQYWSIHSKRHGDLLGSVKWYGPWRQYVFEPYNALFNTGCLLDVVGFIKSLMEARKAKEVE